MTSKEIMNIIKATKGKERKDLIRLHAAYDGSDDCPGIIILSAIPSVELLKEKLESGNYTIPNYILGSEVAYFEGISTVKEIKKLCIEGTDLMLLELPFTTWDNNLIHELRSLEEQRGVKLILAHIERYFSFKENRKLLNELIDSRFLIQLNAECFSSYFKRIRLLRMIRLDQVDFLGSDSHNLDSRCPNLDIARKVISRKLGQDTLLSLDHRSKSILDKYTKKIGRSINGIK